MGNRIYLGSISNEKYEIIKDLNENELINMLSKDKTESYFSNSDITDDGFQIGEEYFPDINENGVTNLFNNYEPEYSALVIDQTIVLKIIDSYESAYRENYEKILRPFLASERNELNMDLMNSLENGFDKKMKYNLYKLLEFVRHRGVILGAVDIGLTYKPSVLDKSINSKKLADSTSYEHDVFDLLNLYKNFDWENKKLIFYIW